jgi:AcrR family transcriptional regulator
MTEATAARPGLVGALAGRTAAPRGGWRERLIGEASHLTRTEGWQTITMAKLADRLGISRQTVYNEIGTKQRLAEALVMHELDRFLQVVDACFANNPDDIVEAIRETVRSVLEMARSNPLLNAVLSSTHGADSELLPLLTTQSEPLFQAARDVVGAHVRTYEIPIPAERIDSVIDAVIRLVLSHVTAPSTASPEETADNVAWIAEHVLRQP